MTMTMMIRKERAMGMEEEVYKEDKTTKLEVVLAVIDIIGLLKLDIIALHHHANTLKGGQQVIVLM